MHLFDACENPNRCRKIAIGRFRIETPQGTETRRLCAYCKGELADEPDVTVTEVEDAEALAG